MRRSLSAAALWGACLLLAPSRAPAHPGGRDAQNGHTCRTGCEKWDLRDGEYHVHGASGAVTRQAKPRSSPKPAPQTSKGSSAISEAGPLGFTWGMSVGQVEGLGIKVVESGERFGFRYVTLAECPKPLKKSELVFLYFAEGDGLVKVRWVSVSTSNDPFGTDGREFYSSLKQVLLKKYGEPMRSLEVVGRARYNYANQFYECLQAQECGYWGTVWKAAGPHGGISIELNGEGPGIGFVALEYDSKKLTDVLKDREEATDRATADAL